jgi:hypothetical protein
MEEILKRIIDSKIDKPKTRSQKELQSIFGGTSYNKTKLNILNVSDDGVIILKRNLKTYKIKKVDRNPKRWDFIFFKEEEYQGSWFKKTCGNFFLVKKFDGHVYFDDLDGFDCHLGLKHCVTYEVIEKY